MESTTQPFQPLSHSFHRSFYFFEHYFPQLLFAVALPTIISLIIFWTGVGVTLIQLNTITSIDELAQLFSWGSPTTYMFFMMAIVLFCLNILGLIAAPLVMVEHERIRISEIVPRTLPYFFAYLRLGVLVVLTMAVLYVISYLLITIISSVAGFIDVNYLDSTFSILAKIIPNVAIVLMAIFFMFSPYVLVQQNKGAYHALMTSARLVRLHWWPIILRLAIVLSCVFMLGFLLLFIPFIGYGLSLFVSALIMIVYNYVLYEAVTGVTWR